MARSVKKETNKPTYDLVLKVTLANGNQMTLGRIGLFTENNKLHEQVSEMGCTRLATLLTKLTAEIQEHGNSPSQEIDLGF